MENRSGVIKALSLISLAMPGRITVDKRMVESWIMFLDGLDDDCIIEAAKDLCSGPREFPPSVGQVRHRAAEISSGYPSIPSSVVAWERVLDAIRNGNLNESLSTEERRALNFVGGSYQVKHTEKPEIVRAHFLKAYEDFVSQKVLNFRIHGSTKSVADTNIKKLPPKQEVAQELLEEKMVEPEKLSGILKQAIENGTITEQMANLITQKESKK